MMTGTRRTKGVQRTYNGHKSTRFWYPNLVWAKLWWEREQKFLRIRVKASVLAEIDDKGLEYVANRAGLDLYAWALPHWDPASRQPLPLKHASNTREAPWLKFWPYYEDKLNKGAPLAQVAPDPRDITSVNPRWTEMIRMQKFRDTQVPASLQLMKTLPGWPHGWNGLGQPPLPPDLPLRKKNMESKSAKKKLWDI